MRQKLLLFIMLLPLLFLVITQPVQAKSYPTLSVTILKNPISKHMYFAPTYPPCTIKPLVKIKFTNNTNSLASIQTDMGSIISVPPHASKYGYFYGDRGEITWMLLESYVYGGNAYLYLNNQCGFGYAPHKNVHPISPKPVQNPYHRIGAICNDMTKSFAIGRGACAFHGGVNHWLFS